MVHQCSESKLTSAFVIFNSQGIRLNNLARLKGCRDVPFSVIDTNICDCVDVCKLVKW